MYNTVRGTMWTPPKYDHPSNTDTFFCPNCETTPELGTPHSYVGPNGIRNKGRHCIFCVVCTISGSTVFLFKQNSVSCIFYAGTAYH